MTPDRQRQARRHNRNQTFRIGAVVAMSVWTAYTAAWLFAPPTWGEEARTAVVMPVAVVLTVWLQGGLRKENDRG